MYDALSDAINTAKLIQSFDKLRLMHNVTKDREEISVTPFLFVVMVNSHYGGVYTGQDRDLGRERN